MERQGTRGLLQRSRHVRAVVHACCGAAVAGLTTLGLLGLRIFMQPLPVDVTHELVDQAYLYTYVLCTTAAAFVLFGAITGHREDDLRAQSITDPLTGLVNRRYFSNRLDCEVKRCGRSHAPLALLLIDVDRLKTINDTHGHSMGDAMLRTVACCIQQVCRSTDVLARLGGDEFAVLAPVTTARQAVELANRLRAALKSSTPGAAPPSVSIGVSDIDQVANFRPEALLGAADTALYAAKDSGRDCVFVNNTARPRSWSPLPAPVRHNGQR